MNRKVSDRKLKVCYAIYPKARQKHPFLRLRGHYLAEAGFNVGDFVELKLEEGKITIQKIS
ncbi:MAG: SymE family type I addiction module toxin [Bacteroidetes bacterium]|nr:SymE family type I addiction module toxin [Bacteroidota bacterium]